MQHGNNSVSFIQHANASSTTAEAARGSHANPFHVEEADSMPDDVRLTRHVSAYNMEHKVGEGAYGAVFFARDPKQNQVVALKRVAWPGDPSNSEGLPVTTLREIMLLFSVHHENVVHLEEVLHGASDAPFSPAATRRLPVLTMTCLRQLQDT